MQELKLVKKLDLKKLFTDESRKKIEAALMAEMRTLLPKMELFEESLNTDDLIHGAIAHGLDNASRGFDESFHFKIENLQGATEEEKISQREANLQDSELIVIRSLYAYVKKGAKQWLYDKTAKYAGEDHFFDSFDPWHELSEESTNGKSVSNVKAFDIQDAMAMSLDLKFARDSAAVDSEEVLKVANRLRNVFCRKGNDRFQQCWSQLSPGMQQAVISHLQDVA